MHLVNDMRVSEIEVIATDDYAELRARVTSDRAPDDGDRFAPFTLWYRFPPWCHPYLDPDNGDPFLAALLVPAMMGGERLAIPAPVSPRLLGSLPDLQAIYQSFDPRLKRIAVEAASRATTTPAAPGSATGLFLSLGVDSYYSLLKNLREHPDDDDTISHLIPVHGFDVSRDGWDERFPAKMLRNCVRAARETGKTLLPVTTNLRPITRTLARWSLSHGAALASVALALDGLLGTVLIAASTTYDQLYPWGSHPVLDPRWSTEGLTVVHDGCELGRIDKVRYVAASQLVLDTLKVCPYYNCGKCLKCLPTIIDLMQAGALERAATLPHEVDIDRLGEVFRAYQGHLNVENYARRLAQMDDDEGPSGLRQALTEFLASEAPPPVQTTAAQSHVPSLVGKLLSRFSG
jgi:hypothetical protein